MPLALEWLVHNSPGIRTENGHPHMTRPCMLKTWMSEAQGKLPCLILDTSPPVVAIVFGQICLMTLSDHHAYQ